jgi:hypothetical protein
MTLLSKLRPRLKLPSILCRLAFLLLVAYPLSMPFANSLTNHGTISGNAYCRFYYPVFVIAHTSPRLEETLFDYTCFWNREAGYTHPALAP